MADIEWLLEQIDLSPEGAEIGAFFDFDGTIIDGYSAAAFFQYRLRRGEIGVKEVAKSVREAINVERRGHDVSEMMQVGVQAQAATSVDESSNWTRVTPPEWAAITRRLSSENATPTRPATPFSGPAMRRGAKSPDTSPRTHISLLETPPMTAERPRLEKASRTS